jgi:capsular polysaccharide biosynthesis protein
MWGPVSAAAGAVLGLALAMVLEFFSLTIKDERDIEQFLQVPVLATVRHF